MRLDARDFEKYFEVDRAVTKRMFNELHFSDRGIDLRIMGANQFSGIARLQLDPHGIPAVLPGSVTRLLASDPFRFREREAFLLRTHLTFKKSLPSDVIATVVTDPALLSLGGFVAGTWEENYVGPLCVVLFSFRRLEVSYGYVVARLQLERIESYGTTAPTKGSGRVASEAKKSGDAKEPASTGKGRKT